MSQPPTPTDPTPAAGSSIPVAPALLPRLVGCRIQVGTDLETLVRVRLVRGGTAAELHIYDERSVEYGRCVGTATQEIPVWAPEPSDHIIYIQERDSAGHWGWNCVTKGCGEGVTGLETAAETIGSATRHGNLAADTILPVDADDDIIPWTPMSIAEAKQLIETLTSIAREHGAEPEHRATATWTPDPTMPVITFRLDEAEEKFPSTYSVHAAMMAHRRPAAAAPIKRDDVCQNPLPDAPVGEPTGPLFRIDEPLNRGGRRTYRDIVNVRRAMSTQSEQASQDELAAQQERDQAELNDRTVLVWVDAGRDLHTGNVKRLAEHFEAVEESDAASPNRVYAVDRFGDLVEVTYRITGGHEFDDSDYTYPAITVTLPDGVSVVTAGWRVDGRA